ncbi:MAG TPA: hypothetical protein VFN30_06620 [Chitinophagaceae bacterium]|nr:hypothetical protein [Chitinophagaceae bacterium]
MALDEYIFGKLVNYFKNKPVNAALLERRVLLKEIKPRLIILARALTGKAIDIFPAVKEGGFKGNSFFLPESFSFFNSKNLNFNYYIFRVLFLTVQQKKQFNWYQSTMLPDENARKLAQQNAPLILECLFQEYPVAQKIYEDLLLNTDTESTEPIEKAWLYGNWMADKKENYETPDIITIEKITDNKSTTLPKTTIQSKPVEEIINLIVDIKQQEDYVMTHNFEKVDTADEFNGTWRDFDGEDELEDHNDALNELNLKYTIRVDDATHSVYQAEFTDNAMVAESSDSKTKGNFIFYDEWNFYKKTYKEKYIRLYPCEYPFADSDFYQVTINNNNAVLTRLRKMLTSLNNKWEQQHLQAQGGEIDIDMAVTRYVDILSGHTASDNVYISDRKLKKDLSFLLLIDMSLSSDSYASGNRVIDTAKQTAILFGEILNEYHIDFAIQGFYSKTRNYSYYLSLKDFDKSWHTSKHKIGALQPEGYTRIGPALRHSGTLLDKRPAKNKWVILLSDGKPNDFDRYEGRYGVEDVKQSLRELNQQNIHSYALAIESSAKYYLCQMFGQNHYQIVSSPVELLQSFIKLYEKISHHN